MVKSRKRTYRELQYRKMAEGYQLLKSPVADSYHAAAEHYKETDAPIDQPSSHDEPMPPKIGEPVAFTAVIGKVCKAPSESIWYCGVCITIE